ncbi:MAG: formate/nitrite transporter family protein [Oscillospiraceae bacterium]|nr:formate/nitrite transporter family protein [Oscillospiraceae bacterium]MDY3218677.1 formate/nitrite transporter family protein [Candidatus Fimivivens sp.]
MNLFSPAEVIQNYANAGGRKASLPLFRMLALGILAGMLIAMGSAAVNTAACAIENPSIARLISGLLFPFGLGMVVLSGAELFTGNCLLCISVYERRVTPGAVARSLLFVYLGNLAGALLVAAGCVYSGQLGMVDGQLALATIRGAAAKCALGFPQAVMLGFFCNLLVALGVLLSLTAKDTAGRIMGAYLPVCFFVICGFEHCVANMYCIPAGLLALSIPEYAALAAEAGLELSALSWENFLFANLFPVTAGNLLGGMAIGSLLWFGHRARTAVSR